MGPFYAGLCVLLAQREETAAACRDSYGREVLTPAMQVRFEPPEERSMRAVVDPCHIEPNTLWWGQETSEIAPAIGVTQSVTTSSTEPVRCTQPSAGA